MTEADKPKKKIQSSIPELSVGEERKLFLIIRKSSAYITPDTLLFNGWSAGGFALTYIIQHHMKRKRKAEEKVAMEPDTKKRRTKREKFDDPITVSSLDQPIDSPEPQELKKARKKPTKAAEKPAKEESTKKTVSEKPKPKTKAKPKTDESDEKPTKRAPRAKKEVVPPPPKLQRQVAASEIEFVLEEVSSPKKSKKKAEPK
jgi:hypothetical protein